MHTQTPGPDGDRQEGIWSNLLTGLKVVGSELRRIVLSRLRAFEIRQLTRRLEQEYGTLGRLAEPILAGQGTSVAGDAARDVDLSLKQIAFLRDEIALLDDQGTSRQKPGQQPSRDMGSEPESKQ